MDCFSCNYSIRLGCFNWGWLWLN